MTGRWVAEARYILSVMDKLRRIQKRGDLTQDDILYDAALRNLQTLSEATQRLPQNLKDLYPAIPWREISGFRNVLVHNYLGDIDAQTVLRVLRSDLPSLEAAVQGMLSTWGPPSVD